MLTVILFNATTCEKEPESECGEEVNLNINDGNAEFSHWDQLLINDIPESTVAMRIYYTHENICPKEHIWINKNEYDETYFKISTFDPSQIVDVRLRASWAFWYERYFELNESIRDLGTYYHMDYEPYSAFNFGIADAFEGTESGWVTFDYILIIKDQGSYEKNLEFVLNLSTLYEITFTYHQPKE